MAVVSRIFSRRGYGGLQAAKILRGLHCIKMIMFYDLIINALHIYKVYIIIS